MQSNLLIEIERLCGCTESIVAAVLKFFLFCVVKPLLVQIVNDTFFMTKLGRRRLLERGWRPLLSCDQSNRLCLRYLNCDAGWLLVC